MRISYVVTVQLTVEVPDPPFVLNEHNELETDDDAVNDVVHDDTTAIQGRFEALAQDLDSDATVEVDRDYDQPQPPLTEKQQAARQARAAIRRALVRKMVEEYRHEAHD